jgi:predicted dienelactone hydrolase
MRPLEIALLLINVPVLAWSASLRRPPVWARGVAIVALVLLVIQILVEGHRWQIYPCYLVIVWLFLAFNWSRVAAPRIWTSLVGLVCLFGSATLCTVLPVFKFPSPTGPFLIGTVTKHLVDSSRRESHGPRPESHRELMIQIWYPAQSRGPGQFYCVPAGLPLKKNHLSLVGTHAADGVPVARKMDRYPILIFSPSWTGGRIQNTFQAEELASHGFIVVGIDHPYSTHKTVFPDGRVITSVLGEWLDFSSDSKLQATLRIANDEVRLRTADAGFVLDTLQRLDQHDPDGLLTGRLDTARVGIWGHSFGGAVAAEACRMDRRFRAAIDLDGCLFGESATAGVEQPFLVMSNDEPLPGALERANSTGPTRRYLAFMDQDERNIRNSLVTHGGYFVRVRGTSHMNFCDSPLYSPIKRLTGAGPIDVGRAMRITNVYTLGFFKQYLVGRPEDLLSEPVPFYSDARLEKWPRPRG